MRSRVDSFQLNSIFDGSSELNNLRYPFKGYWTIHCVFTFLMVSLLRHNAFLVIPSCLIIRLMFCCTYQMREWKYWLLLWSSYYWFYPLQHLNHGKKPQFIKEMKLRWMNNKPKGGTFLHTSPVGVGKPNPHHSKQIITMPSKEEDELNKGEGENTYYHCRNWVETMDY